MPSHAGIVRFFTFCAAGSIGFVVDAGLCAFLIGVVGFSPLTARVASVLVAMTTTWLINRTMTFGQKSIPEVREWLSYLWFNSWGAMINYAVYASVILAMPAVGTTAAIALGSAAGLAFNFILSDRIVFSGNDKRQ